MVRFLWANRFVPLDFFVHSHTSILIVSSNFLIFVSPYSDARVIIPNKQAMIVKFKNCSKKGAINAQKEITVLNRPIKAAAGCVKLPCSYISSKMYVRLRHKVSDGFCSYGVNFQLKH